MTDKEHTISESADKIVLKTSLKRGTETRDQDKLDVKVKGSDPTETAKKLEQTLAQLEVLGVVETMRNTQPSKNDD